MLFAGQCLCLLVTGEQTILIFSPAGRRRERPASVSPLSRGVQWVRSLPVSASGSQPPAPLSPDPWGTAVLPRGWQGVPPVTQVPGFALPLISSFPSLSPSQWCAQKRKSSSSVHLMVSSSHYADCVPVWSPFSSHARPACAHHPTWHVWARGRAGAERKGAERPSHTLKGPRPHGKEHAAGGALGQGPS